MLITQTEQGFIADDGATVKVVASLEELFRLLLRYYEGRCRSFASEDGYGSVKIFRQPPAVYPGHRG